MTKESTAAKKTRRVIEDFIDTHVRYFGDTTKTVLVDELMEALTQPTITDEEIQKLADVSEWANKMFVCEPPCDSYGVCSECISRDYYDVGFIHGFKAALAKMKGEK